MSDQKKCKHCGQCNVRVKATRPNSISYQCKSCQGHFSQPIDEDEKTFEEISKNEAKASVQIVSDKDTPPSSEEIFNRFGFDPDVWEVNRYEYKESERHTAANGFYTLYQVEAQVVRKRAVDPEIPPIQSVKFDKEVKKTKPKIKLLGKKKALHRALLLPDAHIGFSRDMMTGKLLPYHDRSVWDIVFKILANEQFDKIILQGDTLDLPEWSDKFVRTPDMYATTQPAIIETAWILRKLRLLAPNAEIDYMEGNHEQRMPRIMLNQLAAAYGITSVSQEGVPVCSVPSLLDFESSDINWVGDYPNNMIWLNENLRVIHGDKSKRRSGQTAEGYLEHARSSVLFAHIHRRERASKTLHHMKGPRIYESACAGMMGCPKRTPASTTEHDWQQGFTIVEYQEGDGGFDIQIVPVHEGVEAIYKGQVWTGEDYTEELASDTGWDAFKQ